VRDLAHYEAIRNSRLWTEFGLVLEFIEVLQLVTTSKDHALTLLQSSQISIGHCVLFSAAYIKRCLVHSNGCCV
jgi:hypothetical protein